MPTRREQVEKLLEKTPQDSFLRYALAMEQRRDGEHEPSIAMLQGLMKDQPPYVAAFLMAAQQLSELDRTEEARTALRDGIEAARSQGNSHAAGEMAELLAQLGSQA